MDSYIVNKVESQLKKIRFQAELKYKSEIESIYSANPKLLDLENKRRMIASDFTLDKSEKNSLLQSIRKEIDAYILENNIIIPTVTYHCPICRDTGYVDSDNVRTRCTCFTKLMIEESLKDEPSAALATFDSFDEGIFNDDIKKEIVNVKNILVKYSDIFPNVKKPNIILCGNTGTGKTFMLSCIYSALKKRGVGVVFLTAGKIFDILRKYAFNVINDIDVLLEAEVLIIDDFGTEPLFNNVTVEYMFMLINERTKNHKAICLSTNLTPDQIKERYTERIASRLFDQSTTNVFRIPGSDLRLRK